MGFFINLLLIDRIYCGSVALTITVWQLNGRYLYMSYTWDLKPWLSISSASSNISNLILVGFKCCSFIMWKTRPGVPLTRCTPISNLAMSSETDVPPKQACACTLSGLPRASATRCVCYANSLVGDKTSTCGALIPISIFCSAPRQNTAVFPVPDWLCTITSLPEMMGMMDRCCTAEGLSKPE
jgi:hypothetical protein